MQELDEILTVATAAIADPYFLLPISSGNPVNRERVYCYELYHQMRAVWPGPDVTDLLLNGEVDKRAHHGMQQLGVTSQKPDFLVHRPGDMAGNHAIIEVKPSKTSAREIRKDLKTLAVFRAGPHYERGIYLIYGETADSRFIQRIQEQAGDVQGTAGIEVWLHSQVGVGATRVVVLD